MPSIKNFQKKSILIFISFLTFCLLLPACSKAQNKTSDTQKVPITKSEPWTENDIIMPAALNNELKNTGEKPMLIQMGFKMLYDQSHIPGSIFAGPAFRNDGIQALHNILKDVDRNKEVVLYCGCCKWIDCPNITPVLKL